MWLASLDLSLTSTGGVAIPAGWGGDWDLFETMTCGYELKNATPLEEAQRQYAVADYIGQWLFWLGHGDPEKIRVFVEDLPRFGGAHKVLELAMLRAEVQRQLTPFHIVLEVVPLSSARTTLLGTLPQGKAIAKKTAIATARSLCAGSDPFESDDEVDAFIVLNHELSKLGEHAFVAPPKPKKKRAKRK